MKHPHKKEPGHKSLGVRATRIKALKARVEKRVKDRDNLFIAVIASGAFLAGTLWGVVLVWNRFNQ